MALSCVRELDALRRCPMPVHERRAPFESCSIAGGTVFLNATLPQQDGDTLLLPGRWGDSRHAFKQTWSLVDTLVASSVVPGDVIVELGTYIGFATFHLAFNAKPGVQIITVDSGSSNATGIDSRRRYPEYDVGQAFKRAPAWLRSRITQVVSRTSDFDPSPYAGRASLVWVDAGHSLDACLHDSMLAISMVRPGGFVLWDDVSSTWSGVLLCMRRLQSRLQNTSGIEVASNLKPWAAMEVDDTPLARRFREWWRAEKRRIGGNNRHQRAASGPGSRDSARSAALDGGFFVAQPYKAAAWYRRPCCGTLGADASAGGGVRRL